MVHCISWTCDLPMLLGALGGHSALNSHLRTTLEHRAG